MTAARAQLREDVLVVLNEREPLKAQLTSSLLEQLAARRLGGDRLRPCPGLAEVIIARNPRVLVIDYLLEDEGTALDVLSAFAQHGATDIETIVWTDERSTQVAVHAMKLGAVDYIETDSPKSLERLLECIERVVGTRRMERELRPREPFTAVRPIADAQSSRAAMHDATRAVMEGRDVIVLIGPPGCGRSTYARYLHVLRPRSGSYFEYDLELWTDEYDVLVGPSIRTPLLSHGATVFIDHAEFDIGQLPEVILDARSRIWRPHEGNAAPLLVIGTREADVGITWARLFDTAAIEIPGLANRREDMLPLVTAFFQEFKRSGVPVSAQITPTLIDELLKHDWPGNVRELRSALLDLATAKAAHDALRGGRNDERPLPIEELLSAAHERWRRLSVQVPNVPEPLTARVAYDRACGNLRFAAAMLGTGVPQLREALGLTLSVNGTK